MTQVVLLLAPRVHLLDLAGPAQVFSTADELGMTYRLSYVAERAEVVSAQGLGLSARTELPDLASDDLVLVPGWFSGEGAHSTVFAASTLAWLRAHHTAGGTVASVCSGADALGASGLLDGRRFTTHHELTDSMAARYPDATVTEDVLYVADDRVVTSAGIASGIDLALHVLATRHGPGFAARVARSMVVFTRRNGNEPQDSAMLRHRDHLSDVTHHVQDVIDQHFPEPLPLKTLAAGAGVAQRTLTRLFTEATGLTPLRYQQQLRVERAQHLIGRGATAETAARAVGFDDARMLRRLRARQLTPSTHP